MTLLLRIAFATCDTPTPRAERRFGSSCTRSAYFACPHTPTEATPSIVESRWAIAVSAYSSTCVIGSTFDVSAMFKIGDADGFCLRYDGGRMVDGRYGSVFPIAAFTSCAAAST